MGAFNQKHCTKLFNGKVLYTRIKDDIMSRILVYGEDGLTLKYTKDRLGDILHKLGDNSNPADCTVFYRPSFGRRDYGEFDAIIISQKKAYLVETKWDGSGNLSEGLEEHQIRRHRILKWFGDNWKGEIREAWDRFRKKNNPEFERKFEFYSSKGVLMHKTIPKSHTILGQNLQTILVEIGNRKLENVLLIFYRDMPPEVEQDEFTTVVVQYNPTLDLFTELE